VLSSQMRQVLIKRLQENVRGLAGLKKKGVKVGLGYQVQEGGTLHTPNAVRRRLLGGGKGRRGEGAHTGSGLLQDEFRVGAEQLPSNAELTIANLIERNGGTTTSTLLVMYQRRSLRTGGS